MGRVLGVQISTIMRKQAARIAVLMTCHNRVNVTLHGLWALERASQGVDHDTYLVDDGSTDGTDESIKLKFPLVKIIQGDGKLYWAKGMRLAWEMAAKTGEYDFYLWLNDDLALKTDAISNILADYMFVTTNPESPIHSIAPVIVGACADDATESTCSYSATDRADRKIIPNGVPQKADGWLNGNFVLVPKDVYDNIGMISGDYTHARADYDYAERLKQYEIPFYCSSRYVGVCHNDFDEKMRSLTLLRRIKLLWCPGYWNLHDLWLIRRRYHGVWKAILSCMHLILIALKGIK